MCRALAWPLWPPTPLGSPDTTSHRVFCALEPLWLKATIYSVVRRVFASPSLQIPFFQIVARQCYIILERIFLFYGLFFRPMNPSLSHKWSLNSLDHDETHTTFNLPVYWLLSTCEKSNMSMIIILGQYFLGIFVSLYKYICRSTYLLFQHARKYLQSKDEHSLQ